MTGFDIQPNTVISWNPATDSSTSVTLSLSTSGSAGPETVVISQANTWEATYWDVANGPTSQLVRLFCSVNAAGVHFVSKELGRRPASQPESRQHNVRPGLDPPSV